LRERVAADGKTTVLGDAPEILYNSLVHKLRALPFPVVVTVNDVAAAAREARLSPDYAEGVHAFLQNRPPVFAGRKAL
jgi:hypothetical protein